MQALKNPTTWIILVLALLAGIMIGKRFSSDNTSTPGVAVNSTQPRQLWTCGMHPQVIQDHPGDCPICHMKLVPLRTDVTPSTSSASGPVVTIDPVVTQNMGLRLAKVEKADIVSRARVVGYLQEPEPMHRDINLRVNGWIEKLYANIDGMDITAGQPLFDLYSPELRGAIEELIAARNATMRGTGGAESLKLLTEGVERKLELMGLTRQQVEQFGKAQQAPATVPILAPISGHVTEKMVYEGSAVKSGDLVMRIASRQVMWLDTQVYESQLPLIHLGDSVTATVDSQPGRVFSGKIVFIHPHLDPTTRTARVRVELHNDDMLLREGMYATVEITGAAAKGVAAVPREAIIDTGSRQIVFVSLGEGRFEPRRVRVGQSGEGMVEIASGLLPGETVVVSGQFLLDSESRLKEAIAKHLQGELVATTLPTPAEQTVPHVDEIVRAYLAITKSLGADQIEDKPVDLDPLLAAARMSQEHGDAGARSLVQPVIAAAEKMRGALLSDQRKLLLPLSEAMLALADRARPSKSVGETLYVAQCPMALDERGAVWIQDHPEIANPYFATSMKTCGEIVREIAPKETADERR